MVRETLPHVPGFQILRRIGAGAYGTVFQAIQDGNDRPVALKLFEPVDDPEASLPAEIEREREIAASLRHRNLVRIHAMGEYGGRHWLAWEYLPGGTLAEAIGTGLPLNRALSVLHDLARGLGHAHRRGVIHGDVKPDNVLFREARGRGDAVLIDYGVASRVHGAGSLAPGGTPDYMSPERLRSEPVDARSDLYSLGMVLHEMLTGRLPRRDPREPASLDLQPLPVRARWVKPLIETLLAADPADRPSSTDALLLMLSSLQAASPEAVDLVPQQSDTTNSARVRGINPSSSWWHAHRGITAMLLALLVIMVLSAVYW